MAIFSSSFLILLSIIAILCFIGFLPFSGVLRMGNVVGIHEVHINTGTQTLVLKHESGSRAMLADGAVAAARFMEGKVPGFYNMESILNQK